MFGFLKLHSTPHDDPLRSPAAASAWLQCLPPEEDAATRQRRVLAAVEEVGHKNGAADPDRIAAIDFVDAAADADRRRLIAQYTANADRSPAIADALWETIHRLNVGFIAAYQRALENGYAHTDRASRNLPIPLLLARLIRCYGIDSKLQAFRFQRWIPAKWAELHRCYRLAIERGVECLPLPRDAAPSDAPVLTIEQEYVAVLLVQRIDTGNLAPAEFDFISERLRQGARDLAFTLAPRSPQDFVVDIDSQSGLARLTTSVSGPTLRYLDTVALAAQLRREIAALAERRSAAPGLSDRQRSERIATLDRTRRALCAPLVPDRRGAPRNQVGRRTAARFGLAQIHVGLTEDESCKAGAMPADGARIATAMAATLADLQAITRRPTVGRPGRTQPITAASGRSIHNLPGARKGWTIVDRSITGILIRGPANASRGLAIGTLVALDAGAHGGPVLCVVCRAYRSASDTIDVGLTLIAGRVVAATLHTQCPARNDMHGVVGGVDLSAVGTVFRGLLLPPRAWPDTALAGGTLIVPAANGETGRRVVLATSDHVCTVILGQPLERHAEWTWTAFEVAGSASGARAAPLAEGHLVASGD